MPQFWCLAAIVIILVSCPSVQSSWDEWWTYDGISGPKFWGRLNPRWSLCTKGRRQSPVNIDPSILLFDPSLPPFTITGSHVNGHLINTGRGITFKVSTSHGKELVLPKRRYTPYSVTSSGASSQVTSTTTGSPFINNNPWPDSSSSVPSSFTFYGLSSNNDDSKRNVSSVSSDESSGSDVTRSETEPIPSFSISNGPLSYTFTLSHVTFHFGRTVMKGSEHTIDGNSFPGEVQLTCYNSQLYTSYEEASVKPAGLAVISVLVQVTTDPKISNLQLKRITHALKNVTSKGQSQYIPSLVMSELINSSQNSRYMTYEGSLTEPGCFETVTWIILNRPIYMTTHLFHSFVTSMSSDPAHHSVDNFRPLQQLNGRTLRTNIDFQLNVTSSQTLASSSSSSSSSASSFASIGSKRPSTFNDFEVTDDTDLDKYSVGSTVNMARGDSNSFKSCSMKRNVFYKANVAPQEVSK